MSMVYKPLCNLDDVQNGELNNAPCETTEKPNSEKTLYDAVVLGVAHKEFLNINLDSLKKNLSVVYDLKGVLMGDVDGKL